MERLHGPTLLQALGAGEVSLPDAAGILHDLHTRLHAIPAPDGLGTGPSPRPGRWSRPARRSSTSTCTRAT